MTKTGFAKGFFLVPEMEKIHVFLHSVPKLHFYLHFDFFSYMYLQETLGSRCFARGVGFP